MVTLPTLAADPADADARSRAVQNGISERVPKRLARKGFTVCTTARPWGAGRVDTFTPCCGARVRPILGESFDCPHCRWLYVVTSPAGNTARQLAVWTSQGCAAT
jgi:hypothetical protein